MKYMVGSSSIRFCFNLCFFLMPWIEIAAQECTLKGIVLEYKTNNALADVVIAVNEDNHKSKTNSAGEFEISTSSTGEQIVMFEKTDFGTKKYPVFLEPGIVNLGIIYLERDLTVDKKDELIALTENDLTDVNSVSSGSGLLQASRDVFLSRAAFDFGQAFFKVRGYDSRNGLVLLNGIPMNRIWDERPQWNNWGGLNDITRNQEFVFGLEASEDTFGSYLGSTNINTSPSNGRPGIRLSSSMSNRTYVSRVMATYNSGRNERGWAYNLSASRRWAQEGYIEGTLYDAYSLFSSVEYAWNQKHSIGLTTLIASNRRGRSSALTDEVFELMGPNYNPYWGWQDGALRTSRERTIKEPIAMLNYALITENIRFRTGIAYQWGLQTYSRMGYYDAPNPDPTYYRYLPSYYINSPIGANFIGASTAKKAFIQNPQWPWEQLYAANTNESRPNNAAYALYDDVTDEQTFFWNMILNADIAEYLKVDAGLTYRDIQRENFARINDLFGAEYLSDKDPFSNTQNDLSGDLEKEEGALFNYHYQYNVQVWDAFVQTRCLLNRWDTFISAHYSKRKFQRNGLFLNERYLENSLGNSITVPFEDFRVKAGIRYRVTSRHWIKAHASIGTRAPALKYIFINPRENNEVVPNIESEKISSVDVNYLIRMPKLSGRISGFYTRFQNSTDINFFYVDAGVGSDFVQEVVTEMDRLHKGLEIGLEYQFSAPVKLSMAGSITDLTYASDPLVTINFDTSDTMEEPISIEGNIDLGRAQLKDYKLAQGPQKALSFGIEYRDPSYWWIGATANYLAQNYIDISTITRTSSFKLDPDNGVPFPEATEDRVKALLLQRPLPSIYLLNLIGGKSWLRKRKYISVFASINNVFNEVFRTGGYEQSRNGNFGQMVSDTGSGQPSFGPKYWFGFGRTFFLNFAISF